jgi:hypothetical protein
VFVPYKPSAESNKQERIKTGAFPSGAPFRAFGKNTPAYFVGVKKRPNKLECLSLTSLSAESIKQERI